MQVPLGRRTLLRELLRGRARNTRSVHPLAYGQRALWFLHWLNPGSAAYHVGFSARVLSQLDRSALQRAVEVLTERHAALRSTFEERNGEVMQVVAGWREPHFEEIDATTWSQEDLRTGIQRYHAEPFDFARGPLTRWYVLRTPGGGAALLLTQHHLVTDFWSLDVLLDELAELYKAEVDQRVPKLPSNSAPYRAFVEAQRRLLRSSDGQRLETYWLKRLEDTLPHHGWSFLPHRTSMHAPAQGSLFFEFDPHLTGALRSLARANQVTLYMLLLAAYQALAYRLSDSTDVVTGSTAAGRREPAFRSCVGYFSNMIVLRSQVSGQAPFSTFLRQVRTTVLEAAQHQEYPFECLVAKRNPDRGIGNPIFQSTFMLRRSHRFAAWPALIHDCADTEIEWAGLRLRPLCLRQQEGQVDLALEIADVSDRLLGVVKFQEPAFCRQSAEVVQHAYETLIRAIVRDPHRAIDRLPLVGEAAARRLTSCSRQEEAPPRTTLVMLFEEQVRRSPQRRAVTCGAASVSYCELDERATFHAARLQEKGVRPGDLVGICARPSIEMVAGLLGILKAGAAYLPLDPRNPAQRLRFMFSDSGARCVLIDHDLFELLDASTERLVLGFRGDVNHAVAATPRDPDALAYVMYTSGSTGVPKGVQITHGNIVNLLRSVLTDLEARPSDVWTALHSYGFDLSVWEIWGCLLSGGRLIIVPSEVARAVDELYALLRAERVTMLMQTPSALRQLAQVVDAEAARALDLRHVVCCGEPLDARLAFEILRWDKTLWNYYGPTETTVAVTTLRITSHVLERGGVPIGRPIANTRAYVLDSRLEPLPAGAVGELYIAGAAVGPGYRGREALTAERFLPDPFRANARMYRTGDRVRFRPDGLLVFEGRVDSQVKIRGYRVELGEIEEALTAHPLVDQAAVLVIPEEHGSCSLTACYLGSGSTRVGEDELRHHLRERLPEYMIPSAFLSVDELPLNAHGKVDRGALEQLAARTAREASEAALSATPFLGELEKSISDVWREVLRRPVLGAEANFFDAGGDSLMLLRVHQRLRDAGIGRELVVNDLFRHPTVRSLARRLAGKSIQKSVPEGETRGAIRLQRLAAKSGCRRRHE